MPFVGEFPDADPLRGAIEAAYRADETARVEALLGDAAMDAAALQRVADTARGLVDGQRGRWVHGNRQDAGDVSKEIGRRFWIQHRR